MRSCLEIYSLDGSETMPYGRHQQELRSDYQRVNQYSATHPDALSPLHDDGKGRKGQGKGTGHGGHSHWLPNCKGQLGVFNFSNFDTAISSGAGNEDDNNARNIALTRSLYNDANPYGVVDTSINVNEGQFVLR